MKEGIIMKIENRFLKYISFNTQSNPYSTVSPSTTGQKEFAQFLVEEMRILGLENVHMSEYGVVYGTIPSNNNHQGDVIGLIAHMDTSPDASGENIHPQIIRNYDGQKNLLHDDMYLDPQEFPDLKEVIGHDLNIMIFKLLLRLMEKVVEELNNLILKRFMLIMPIQLMVVISMSFILKISMLIKSSLKLLEKAFILGLPKTKWLTL